MAIAEGAWALIGVGVGVVGAGLFQVAQVLLQRRWTKADADRARKERDRELLFEHKRAAYLAFLRSYNETAVAFLNDRMSDTWALTLDLYLSHAADTRAAVLYGSKQCADLVGEINLNWLGLVVECGKLKSEVDRGLLTIEEARQERIEAERSRRPSRMELLERYEVAARRDLGIVD